MKSFLLSIILLFFSTSCEKRILLNTDFPQQENRILCELIGFVDRGFLGNITQVQKVGSNIPHQALELTIREEGDIIFNRILETPKLRFPFPVKENTYYDIEIQYLDQTVTSPKVKGNSPFLAISELAIDNSFIDSLGFYVASVSFDFTATGNTTTDSYFAYSIELLPAFSLFVKLDNISKADSLVFNRRTFIHKRLPNISNYNIAQVGLLSIDASLYQYLKNIEQLGIIPNDNIEGHHGNLDGGIGYFGMVNYDLKEVSF